MKKTYKGGCHCGKVRFEAEIDLAQGTVRCNCSYCSKIRCWAALVAPHAFRLLAGADALGDYQFHSMREHQYFCRQCGVRVYGVGESARLGVFYGISVNVLDDVSEDDLAAVPVTYVNGRDDLWDQAPRHTGH